MTFQLDDEAKREYFRALINNLDSQRKYMLLYVTFALAAVAGIFGRFVLGTDSALVGCLPRVLVTVTLFGFSGSAFFNFLWIGFLNRLSVKAIDYLVTLNLEEARRIHYPGEEFYRQHGWVLRVGKTLLAVGVAACVGLVITVVI